MVPSRGVQCPINEDEIVNVRRQIDDLDYVRKYARVHRTS